VTYLKVRPALVKRVDERVDEAFEPVPALFRTAHGLVAALYVHDEVHDMTRLWDPPMSWKDAMAALEYHAEEYPNFVTTAIASGIAHARVGGTGSLDLLYALAQLSRRNRGALN
jgi:hypothetical protein